MKGIKKEGGFTLIELIVIIVVLGILTAVAVTRYQDLTSDANISASKGNLGTMRAGVQLLHAKFLVAGVSGSNPEWPTTAELNNNITAGRTPASLNGLKLIEGPSTATCTECMPENLVGTGTLAQRKTVVQVGTGTADARTPSGGSEGWAYDPASGQLYVNQAAPTDGKGVPANQW